MDISLKLRLGEHILGYESTLHLLPTHLILRGTVIKGFGRGSKELGIPTANLDVDALGESLDGVGAGIYCGFAYIDPSPEEVSVSQGEVPSTFPTLQGKVYKMVMSIGWNPFFKNEKKTVEPYLIHDFGGKDFYGSNLSLVVTAFLRPELNYTTLENLITAIHKDIDLSSALLDLETRRDEIEKLLFERI
jgi:riboflavin kinase